MRQAPTQVSGSRRPMRRLYHGSDVIVSTPQVSLNDGFADLGRGFYLTDSLAAARQRAAARARGTSNGGGVVSAFELDEGGVPWISWGTRGPVPAAAEAAGPFGLRFDGCREGIAAWVTYIRSCRAGRTELAGHGSPAIVRGWIATEEVEMACAGLLSADDLAELVSPHELTVQYCLTDQAVIDQHLVFVESLALD